MDFTAAVTDNAVARLTTPDHGIVSDNNFMLKKSEAAAPASESEDQRFERILALPQFKPLKAVLENLGCSVSLIQAAIATTTTYQLLLGKLGYRVVVVKQIHENDCYSRLGAKGGIRAVLPVHDTATYSTLVTLVNFDSTVTTTANSVVYYDAQLAEFKVLLHGNAA